VSHEQDRQWVALFLEYTSGRTDMADSEFLVGTSPLDHRRHALEHIVAKHEVVNESRRRMAHGQGCERPCAEFM
jgi:hypothetical protein